MPVLPVKPHDGVREMFSQRPEHLLALAKSRLLGKDGCIGAAQQNNNEAQQRRQQKSAGSRSPPLSLTPC